MKPENMPKADFVVSILLMIFSVWVVIHSLKMPRFENLGANPFSVPGIVPGVLGTIVFVLSLAVFIRSVRQHGHHLELSYRTMRNFFNDASVRRMLLTASTCIIYGMAMVGRINYYLATFVFVLFFLQIFQYRSAQSVPARPRLIIASTVLAGLTAAIVGAVFRYLFLVDLP